MPAGKHHNQNVRVSTAGFHRSPETAQYSPSAAVDQWFCCDPCAGCRHRRRSGCPAVRFHAPEAGTARLARSSTQVLRLKRISVRACDSGTFWKQAYSGSSSRMNRMKNSRVGMLLRLSLRVSTVSRLVLRSIPLIGTGGGNASAGEDPPPHTVNIPLFARAGKPSLSGFLQGSHSDVAFWTTFG
jgi:hypothetical protein